MDTHAHLFRLPENRGPEPGIYLPKELATVVKQLIATAFEVLK